MTTINHKKLDNIPYFRTEKEMADYLNTCLEQEDDNPELIAAVLGYISRGKGMTRLARETGICRESLYRSLSGEGNPRFGTILKVTKALGLRLRITVK